MSWKSFVTAGLLCALASPAFAVPTLSLVKGGTFANNHLNAAGDWVWKVQITPTSPLPPGDATGTPLSTELGFAETVGELLGATNFSTIGSGTGFDTNNPGEDTDPGAGTAGLYPWLTLTVPPAGGPALAEGLQFNTAADQAFAALGSQLYLVGGAKDFIAIQVAGPQSSALTTTIEVEGSHGAGDAFGRIAEYDSDGVPPVTANYDTYAGTFTRNAQDGDADLNGVTNFFDLQTLLGKYNQAGEWYDGDSTGDDLVNFFDLQALLGKYNMAYSVGPGAGAGSGLGGGGAVPEPTSAVLLLLAASLLGFRRSRS